MGRAGDGAGTAPHPTRLRRATFPRWGKALEGAQVTERVPPLISHGPEGRDSFPQGKPLERRIINDTGRNEAFG